MKRALPLAAVVAAAALWFLFAPTAATPTPAEAGRRALATRDESTWALELRGHTVLPPLDARSAAMPSDVVTTGELRLRSYGPETVGLTLTRLDDATMTLFGQAAMQDRAGLVAALTGGEAVLTLRPEGDLRALDFTPDSAPLFRSFAQTVAGELQLPVRDGAEWTLLDTTLRGKAVATYSRTAEGFRRVRTRYATLNAFGRGLGDVTLSAQTDFTMRDGVLVALRSQETLEGVAADGTHVESTLELTLTRLRAAPLVATAPQVLTRSALDELTRPRDLETQFLAQRVGGLTARELFDGVATQATGSPQAVARFLPKASGLLLQQPELCAQLAARALDPATPPKERLFTIEVMAAAGSREAQAAMREVLGTTDREALASRERLQRFALLEEPTRETVDFVGERWRTGGEQERRTAAVVLGALAGQLAKGPERASALPWVDALAAALASESREDVREALIDALGNAGLEAHVDDVLGALSERAEGLRVAAVLALRKTPTSAARAGVVRALEDSSSQVQGQAVEVLRRWGPTPTEQLALTSALRSGRMPVSLAPGVLNALAAGPLTPETKDFLQWLTTVREADPSVQRRARTMLEETR